MGYKYYFPRVWVVRKVLSGDRTFWQISTPTCLADREEWGELGVNKLILPPITAFWLQHNGCFHFSRHFFPRYWCIGVWGKESFNILNLKVNPFVVKMYQLETTSSTESVKGFYNYFLKRYWLICNSLQIKDNIAGKKKARFGSLLFEIWNYRSNGKNMWKCCILIPSS